MSGPTEKTREKPQETKAKNGNGRSSVKAKFQALGKKYAEVKARVLGNEATRAAALRAVREDRDNDSAELDGVMEETLGTVGEEMDALYAKLDEQVRASNLGAAHLRTAKLKSESAATNAQKAKDEAHAARKSAADAMKLQGNLLDSINKPSGAIHQMITTSLGAVEAAKEELAAWRDLLRVEKKSSNGDTEVLEGKAVLDHVLAAVQGYFDKAKDVEAIIGETVDHFFTSVMKQRAPGEASIEGEETVAGLQFVQTLADGHNETLVLTEQLSREVEDLKKENTDLKEKLEAAERDRQAELERFKTEVLEDANANVAAAITTINEMFVSLLGGEQGGETSENGGDN